VNKEEYLEKEERIFFSREKIRAVEIVVVNGKISAIRDAKVKRLNVCLGEYLGPLILLIEPKKYLKFN
jgi:tartrate dehydratase beta subunit/fumarate hydratase class I family protein